MILTVNDWILDVDIARNMQYSADQAKDHCLCGYCRNFYAAVDASYPDLRPFLTQFGLDIEGPDELCPFEPTIYEVTYVINGTILKEGIGAFSVDRIPIKISAYADLETTRPQPFFTLTIGLMELPWVLDEPWEDVISPANEEAYLERMRKKLLARTMDATCS